MVKSIEELINEMDNDYLKTCKDISQSNSFEYIVHAIKDFRKRWQEKIKPYSPLYLENINSNRKLDHNYRLHNNLCDKIDLLKQSMTNF